MVDAFIHDVPAVRVVFGDGTLERVGLEVAALGCTRAMLISDGRQSEYDARVLAQPGAGVVAHFTEVVMHVPVPVAERAVEMARDCGADALIALGGGSATGTAKAVAKETRLPIVAIPTTYAGSEMTSIWGLTDNARKITGLDAVVRPKTVVYDPTLTLSLPIDLSAASGMNALAHLVESLYAPNVSPVLMLQAQEGVRALASALPRVVAHPDDLAARGEAMYGAWLAGWALGTTSLGIHHKVCHTLGGTFDLPHAQTHSAVLPYAIAFNNDYAPTAMAAILRALNEAGVVATGAAAGVWDLAAAIGAPTSLKSIGFLEAGIETATELVVAARFANPRPVEPDGVRGLLRAAYEGARPQSESA